MNKAITILLSITLLVACTANNNGIKNSNRFQMYDDYILEQGLNSLNKLRRFKFLNWKSLDNQHLIVSSSYRSQYLVTLQNYCVDLDTSNSIAFDQSISNSLSANFDSIIVADQRNQKCRINTIHQIDKTEENELLKLRKNYLKKSKTKIEG